MIGQTRDVHASSKCACIFKMCMYLQNVHVQGGPKKKRQTWNFDKIKTKHPMFTKFYSDDPYPIIRLWCKGESNPILLPETVDYNVRYSQKGT